MGVPRPIPVGTVADRLLINVHTLPRWNHPVPSKAVGTWSNSTDSSPQGQVAHMKSIFQAPFCLVGQTQAIFFFIMPESGLQISLKRFLES